MNLMKAAGCQEQPQRRLCFSESRSLCFHVNTEGSGRGKETSLSGKKLESEMEKCADRLGFPSLQDYQAF